MTALTRRSTSPMAEMLEWLESGTPFRRGFGLSSYVRIEDFVDDGSYVVRAELPGIDPEKDVEVEVSADHVTIRGERREEKKDKNHREFHYGSFYRSIPLPRGAKSEDVTASYADGVLEVRIPAAGEPTEARRISISREG